MFNIKCYTLSFRKQTRLCVHDLKGGIHRKSVLVLFVFLANCVIEDL